MIKMPNRSLRRLSIRLGVGVSIFFLILGIAGARRVRDLRAARETVALLSQEIELTENRVEGLRKDVESLATREEAIERFAREDLGMVRPGDVVIVYD